MSESSTPRSGAAESPLPRAEEGSEREANTAELRVRLREAEETLDAIRNGDVDAVVVGGPSGQQVYTLENADRPYRLLVEEMREGAVTLSNDGLVLYCNQRFAAFVLRDRESLIGGTLDAFFDDEERSAFQALLSADRAAGRSGEFTLCVREHKAMPVNISVVDLRLEEGVDRMVCLVVTDLTQNRRRRDELAASHNRLANEIEERRRAETSLQLALDAAGMGSWDLSLVDGTAERSLRHDQIFGYEEAQVNWTLDRALAHFTEEDRPKVAEALAASAASGGVDIEARICRPADGQIRCLHVTGRTFYEAGRPARIAGVVVDVTDRREVEERLRQAQKIEAIGQLTGGVAHDFNNLLMVISGGLDMIDRQSDPARRRRILDGMRQAVERGAGLSRQLLAFSRRQALRPEPIDLARQIGGMQELLDRSLRGDVHVRTNLAEALWTVEVDPGELELAVLNLAVNARDAMPNGGLVTIAAANFADLREADLKGDYVRLRVSDTGTGMSPEVLAKVFEPFFTTKEVGKGSGLGLAQTHGFALASGGATRISSTPGVGTAVDLYLPRSDKSPAVQVKHAVDLSALVKPLKVTGSVLLVEDDDEVAALTTEMIEQLGYNAVRVGGAEAALGALANGRTVDLVFSDVMMAGSMNGVDLALEIARRRPGLPVLLTSGYAEAARERAYGAGVKILPKPYTLAELGSAFLSELQR